MLQREKDQFQRSVTKAHLKIGQSFRVRSSEIKDSKFCDFKIEDSGIKDSRTKKHRN